MGSNPFSKGSIGNPTITQQLWPLSPATPFTNPMAMIPGATDNVTEEQKMADPVMAAIAPEPVEQQAAIKVSSSPEPIPYEDYQRRMAAQRKAQENTTLLT